MTLRFLADENTPGALVAALRQAGHEVVWVAELAPGLQDGDVLAWASREARVLLTLDKDFGELARQGPLAAGCGVVLLRLRELASVEAARAVSVVFATGGDWAGHVSVIEAGRIRRRALTAETTAIGTAPDERPKHDGEG